MCVPRDSSGVPGNPPGVPGNPLGGADRVRLFVFNLFVLRVVFVRIHILFMYYLYFSCLAHAIVGTCFVYALYELLRPWRPPSNIVVG